MVFSTLSVRATIGSDLPSFVRSARIDQAQPTTHAANQPSGTSLAILGGNGTAVRYEKYTAPTADEASTTIRARAPFDMYVLPIDSVTTQRMLAESLKPTASAHLVHAPTSDSHTPGARRRGGVRLGRCHDRAVSQRVDTGDTVGGRNPGLRPRARRSRRVAVRAAVTNDLGFGCTRRHHAGRTSVGYDRNAGHSHLSSSLRVGCRRISRLESSIVSMRHRWRTGR